MTVIVNRALAVFPLKSVAEQTTLVRPSLNRLPERGLHVTGTEPWPGSRAVIVNVTRTAFALLGAVMFVNALWNYFFFRTGNLFHAYLLGLFYNAIALSLFLLLLLQVDRTAAWSLSPYILYLFYANIWGYRVWKLNPTR